MTRSLCLLVWTLCVAGSSLAAPDLGSPDSTTAAPTPGNSPSLRFGVVTDVQFADKPASGARHYREALAKLQLALTALNRETLSFVVNLGDAIDGHEKSTTDELKRVAAVFRTSTNPVRHVLGNHCHEAKLSDLQAQLALVEPYYEFAEGSWRFLVLHGMDVSVKSPEGSPEAQEARDYLTARPTLPTYNGAIGRTQLRWLKARLQAATQAGARVILFCHHPLFAAASDGTLTLWNAEETLRIIEGSGCVVAVLTGHDHRGGYAFRNGIHHLTLPGIVEAPDDSTAYAICSLFPDRIEVKGFGTTPSRSLPLRGTPER